MNFHQVKLLPRLMCKVRSDPGSRHLLGHSRWEKEGLKGGPQLDHNSTTAPREMRFCDLACRNRLASV
jgi:hypothetical protein